MHLPRQNVAGGRGTSRTLLVTFLPEMPNSRNFVTAITHPLATFARFLSCLPTTIVSLPCRQTSLSCSSLTILSLIVVLTSNISTYIVEKIRKQKRNAACGKLQLDIYDRQYAPF
jgi:hypothetical protein